MIANKYDNKEKIEKQIKYLRCSKLKEMADYLQKMRTTHQIRVPVTKYDRDAKKIGTWLTWEQWVVIAGALNPALKKVCTTFVPTKNSNTFEYPVSFAFFIFFVFCFLLFLLGI